MAQRIATNVLQKRLYGAAANATQSAAKPISVPEVQVGKANNGILVTTQENHSSLARVVCAVKAGSRYEAPHQRGVAHCLRALSDRTQKETRAFRLVRELQQMAATVSVSSSREHLLYTLEAPKGQIESALPLLAGMVGGQSYRPWEISDSMPRIEYELLCLTEQADKRVVEKAHEAAYRQSGLGRSLYTPVFQISEFSPDLLQEYVNQYFTTDRISLSGTGVDQQLLMSAASRFDIHVPSSATDSASKYHGGEVRESSEDLLAYTILVGEGASATKDDCYAFAVLEQLLGAGPQIKWASNTTSNRVNSAIARKTQEPFNVQAFNVNYSDSGLFGVSAVTVPENSELVIKTVMEQLKDIASSPIDDASLQGAKNRAKATLAFQEECASDAACSRAIELLNSGKVTNLATMMSAAEKVSAADVQNAAKKVVGGRLSMASVGEIHNVPYVDEL